MLVVSLLGAVSVPLAAVAARSAGAHESQTRAPHSVTAGQAFTASLLAKAPLPAGAVLTTSLPSPLAGNGELAGIGRIDLHHDYLLRKPIDLATFLSAHKPRGSVVSTSGVESGSGIVATTTSSVSFRFANRHVSLEQLTYASGRASNGEQEFRVDAVVEWMPIRTVLMPTKGVVTITLYRKLSLMENSSDPVSLVLSHTQALAVRSAIASLSNTDYGGCMEDAELFAISVSPGKGQPDTWTGRAEECPSDFYVGSGAQPIALSNGSCTLVTYVGSLFPKLAANETVKILNSCVPAYNPYG